MWEYFPDTPSSRLLQPVRKPVDLTSLAICPQGRSLGLPLLQPQVARTQAALAAPLGLSKTVMPLICSHPLSPGQPRGAGESPYSVITGVLGQLLKPFGSGTFHAESMAVYHGGVALDLVLCSILFVTQSL